MTGNSPKENTLAAAIDLAFTASGVPAPARLLQELKRLVLSSTSDGALAPEFARQEALRIVDEALEPIAGAQQRHTQDVQELLRGNDQIITLLTRHLQNPTGRETPASASRDQESATLITASRALAAASSKLPLVGFPHRGAKPTVHLDAVCIPPKLQRIDFPSVKPWTTDRLLSLLLSDRDPAARVLVLGAPGSGKTTLCRHLVRHLAFEGTTSETEHPRRGALPLFLRVRDYARRPQPCSFIRHVREELEGLHVEVSRERLEDLCTRGRAVLLLDGLDEAGDAERRVLLRERLDAFLERFPRIPVLITTREVGYDQAPVPDHTQGGFLHLRMEPLDDDEIAEFVRRWTTATSEDTGVDNADELLGKIYASPAARSLAETPLLLTLIALMYRHDRRLPGRRVELLDRCTELFLDTWPRRRNHGKVGIQLSRQRHLLESLAASLSYHNEHSPVSQVERKALIQAITTYCLNGPHEAPIDEGTLSDWIDFLSESSGILTEVGPNTYQFAHREIQDYLAACWFNTATDDPVKLIVEHLALGHRRETGLLLAGLRATESSLVDQLHLQVHEHFGDHPEASLFLLDCMGEAPSLSPTTIKGIIRGAIRHHTHSIDTTTAEHSLARILRAGTTVSAQIHDTFVEELRTCSPDALPPLVWAALAATDVTTLIHWLEMRPDAVQSARVLAPVFWPSRGEWRRMERPDLAQLGEWTWRRLSLEASLHLVSSRALKATDLASAALVTLDTGIEGGIVAALALQLALDGAAAATSWSAAAREISLGGLRVEPSSLEIMVVAPPLLCSDQSLTNHTPSEPTRQWTDPRGSFWSWIGEAGELELAEITSPFDGISIFDYFMLDGPTPEDFWVNARVPYGSDYFEEPDDFGDYDEMIPGSDYPLKEFENHRVWHSLTSEFATAAVPPPARAVPDPTTSSSNSHYLLRARLVALRDFGPLDCDPAIEGTERSSELELESGAEVDLEAELAQCTLELHTLHAGQAALAIQLYPGIPASQALFSALRQQHIWMLQNWNLVEQSAQESSSPQVLALALAIGWTQCLTTSHWPDTPWWRGLLAGPPPDHWWPRVQWHTCWLLATPDDERHRDGLAEAIATGLNDPQLGVLARSWLSAVED